MKFTFEQTLIPIMILVVIISCQNETRSTNNEENKIEEGLTTNEVAEEQILKVKAKEYLDAGKTPDKIVKNLKDDKRYQGLLRFMGERDYKNQRKAKKLDFDAYLIDEGIRTKNDLRIKLRYVVENDTVRYGLIKSIYTSSLDPIQENIEFIKDEKFINEYTSKHNQIYATQKRPKDFVKEIIKEDRYIKIASGYAGTIYGEREIKLFKAVGNRDENCIINFLTSMNIENQALGIIGIEKLKRQGVKVSDKAKQIIEYLKEKNALISFDFGCSSIERKLNKYLSLMNIDEMPNIEIK